MAASRTSEHFIVHNYSCVPSVECSSAILQEGCDLIHQAISCSGWKFVAPTRRVDESVFIGTGSNVYSFTGRIPHVDIQKSAVPGLKEWDVPVDSADVVNLDLKDLEEFDSIDLACITISVPTGGDLKTPRSRDGDEPAKESSNTDRPNKRRRIELGSLRDLIPLPHFHPSPHTPISPSSNPRIPPYTKTQPNPIVPYTVSTMQQYLKAPYERSAWIVPLRGALPWEGCTAASVLEPSASLERPGEVSHITWSQSSLQAFWTFLISIKDAKTLGPISLSFHATSPPIIGSTYTSQDLATSADRESMIASTYHNRQFPLQDVDHIKVYHDVEYAMYIRNVLDAWSFDGGVMNSLSEGPMKGEKEAVTSGKVKVRVLKGSRLALVDGKSKGVLVS